MYIGSKINIMLKQLNQLAFIYVLLLFINNLPAQISIRVPADYTKIQDALNAANANTTILVSPGIYYENLVWPKSIDGIKLIGIEGSSKTIIDGSKNGRVVKIEGDYVFNEDQTITQITHFKGFTIRNGSIIDQNGAGLYCDRATPLFSDLVVTENVCGGDRCEGAGSYINEYFGVLENCVFSKNVNQTSSRSYGAGLNIGFTKSLIIRNCTFEKNNGITQSWCFGGGLYIEPSYTVIDQMATELRIVSCRFIDNTTQTSSWSYGAGLYLSDYLGQDSVKCSIDSCQFIGNNANISTWSHGGGLHTEVKDITVSNCQFRSNYAESGAGFYFDTNFDNNSVLKVKNSIFSRNTALSGNTSGGSAIYAGYDRANIELTNIVIDNNTSSPINISDNQSNVTLNYCSIYNNEKKCNFGNAKVNAFNTILWNKPDKEYTTPNSNHTYFHCIVKGGYAGTGNINSDPLLLDPNLPIPTPQSPCINAGKLIPGIETDIQGYPREIPANSLPDIGAYEMDQYFAHAQVKFFYDVNQNKIRDGQERFLSVGSVSDNSGQEYVNFSESGRFIILQQGKTTLTYNSTSNPLWLPTGDQVFELDVNSDTYSQIIEIGLYPKEIMSQVATNVIGENFRCGEEVRFLLTATNYGTKIESGIFWLNIDDRLDSIRFLTAPDEKNSDHNYGWQFSDLYPGESITIEFDVKAPLIDSPDQLGELYAFCHWPSSVESRDAPCYYAELRCSFDPNDKFSIPQREDHLSLIYKPLNYTIRFQNTGNDYARNVVIRDTIDPSFDLRTFKIINTSHPDVLNVTINASREILFSFNNIFLPDSTTNLVGSNGHILYSIEYVDGIVPNTEVNNTANIFFDFNPAIVTNTTKNIIVTAFSVSTENISTTQVLVYPNPTNDELNFDQKAEQVMLYNINGQLIHQSFNTNKIQMNVNTGTYFVKLKINGKNSTHKVVVLDK